MTKLPSIWVDALVTPPSKDDMLLVYNDDTRLGCNRYDQVWWSNTDEDIQDSHGYHVDTDSWDSEFIEYTEEESIKYLKDKEDWVYSSPGGSTNFEEYWHFLYPYSFRYYIVLTPPVEGTILHEDKDSPTKQDDQWVSF